MDKNYKKNVLTEETILNQILIIRGTANVKMPEHQFTFNPEYENKKKVIEMFLPAQKFSTSNELQTLTSSEIHKECFRMFGSFLLFKFFGSCNQIC